MIFISDPTIRKIKQAIKNLMKFALSPIRNDKIIIPTSSSIFNENDDVVFFAETNCIKKLEKLLSINQSYA